MSCSLSQIEKHHKTALCTLYEDTENILLKLVALHWSIDNSKGVVADLGTATLFLRVILVIYQAQSHLVCAPVVGISKHLPDDYWNYGEV